MRTSTELITDIRSDSNDSNTPYAVSTADILRFINWGNQRIYGLIQQTSPVVLQKEVTFSSVANQREYDLWEQGANPYLGERIVKVEYKETSNDRDYYRLKETKYGSYISNPTNNPSRYVRRSGKVLPVPPIDNASGTFRVTYEAAPNEIKQSVGTIASVTDTGTAVTAVSLDTADDDATTIAAASLDFICVTDIYGRSTMLNIGVSSYDSGTGAFTLSPSSHTYATGESIAVGSKVTLGKFTSTTSNLRDECERYLIAYAAIKCMMRTTASPEKIAHFKEELEKIEEEIVMSYREPDKDDDDVQIENSEVMLQDF